jgi:hypothetical protein
MLGKEEVEKKEFFWEKAIANSEGEVTILLCPAGW